MRYIQFFKWSVYRLYKKRWKNSPIVRKYSILSNIYLCILLSFIAMVGVYFAAIQLYDMIPSSYNGRFVRRVYEIVLIAFSGMIIYGSHRYAKGARVPDLISGGHDDEKAFKIIDGVSDIVYNCKELLTIALPVGIVIYRHDGQGIMRLLGFVISVFVVRVMFLIIMCIASYSRIVIYPALFFCSLYLGRYVSGWVGAFPIIGKNIDSERVEQWFSDGEGLFWGLVDKVADAKYIIVIACVLILICSVILSRIDKIWSRWYSAVRRRKSYKDLYDKIAASKKISVFRNIPMWMGTGMHIGVLSGIDKQDTKIVFFVSMVFVVYFGYFSAMSAYKNNLKIFNMCGEGRNIIFWHNDMYRLLMKKWKLWAKDMIVFTVLEYLCILIVSGNLYVLIFMVFQAEYMLILFFIFNIPAIIAPFYMYDNVADIEKSVGYKILEENIEPVMLIVVNSMFAIPVALYMTDYCSYAMYMVLQAGLMTVLAMVFIVVAMAVYRRKLSSDSYKKLIFRR